MNPEFKRNLWLVFSPHRLLAMPIALGLIFITIYMAGTSRLAQNMYGVATGLFVFIVWLWGLRNANSSIVDELRDKTWDQQRMSALRPWSMTWGKLFGATAFNWYGGVLCLSVAAVAGLAVEGDGAILSLLTLAATGVMLHAASIALNLHTSQIETRLIQRGGMGWLAIVFVLFMLSGMARMWPDQTVNWWGYSVDRVDFLLLTSLLFGAWAVFAAWRAMCNALQVRTLPWAWPVFACVMTMYVGGIVGRGENLFTVATTIAVVMTYLALFTEPTGVVVWRRLRARQQAGDWRGWFEYLPLWPTTLVLAFVAAAIASPSSSAWPDTPMHIRNFGLSPLAVALMLLRDVCLFLFFAFSPNSRRAAGTTLFYLIVLDLLLPFLTRVANLDSISFLFMPVNGKGPWDSVGVMAIHVAISLGLVAWRVQRDPLMARRPNTHQ